eukprot:scaffold2739_cov257-Pinguiococcus_pyrenoidosus.AAC.27
MRGVRHSEASYHPHVIRDYEPHWQLLRLHVAWPNLDPSNRPGSPSPPLPLAAERTRRQPSESCRPGRRSAAAAAVERRSCLPEVPLSPHHTRA